MLSLDEARTRLLGLVRPLGSEHVPLARALGRVLAEPLLAPGDLPPFSYSAMDGYAVAAASFSDVGPWELDVVGESRTGVRPPELAPKTAMRIFTGAELPRGADTVVAQEDVERSEERAVFRVAPRTGQHVRRAGEDLARGDMALPAGRRLGPGELALLASLDCAEIRVARAPRVSVLCTGDELRAPGSPAESGKIPDALSLPVSALAERAGARLQVAPYVRDERGATERAVRSALDGSELLVTIGGVSVGDHDLVRPALEACGVGIEFWKVAIKPGKPLACGVHTQSGALVLALPGNPASAFVTFALFGVPLVRALSGDARTLPRTLRLPLAAPYRKKPGRLEIVRARLEDGPPGPSVRPLSNQASGAITSLAWADALALVPADSHGLEAGELVEVVRLDEL